MFIKILLLVLLCTVGGTWALVGKQSSLSSCASLRRGLTSRQRWGYSRSRLRASPDKVEENVESVANPQHVAFIVDGNGRWAVERGLPRQEGHSKGANVTVEIAKNVFRSGIPFLTFFLFSQENWARPQNEVANIMHLLEKYLVDVSAYLVENGIRLVVIGERSRLPSTSQALIKAVEASTEGFMGQTLCLAISYSGRTDILNACRSIQQAGMKDAEISEDIFNKHLSMGSRGIPDPDLLIRTSGEQRLSNFLLYQLAYTEMAFVESRWPDFTVEECQEVISSFGKRERRYGGLLPH